MTIDDTKAFLAKYKELKFEKAVLEQVLNDKNDVGVQERLNILVIQIKILDECLNILSIDEQFVIKNHVLLGSKWETVIELYEETFGQKNAKAERTLKQIQANAIEKIHTLIVKTNTTKYFKQVFEENHKS